MIQIQELSGLAFSSAVDRSENSDFGPNSDLYLKWSDFGPKNGSKSDFRFL